MGSDDRWAQFSENIAYCRGMVRTGHALENVAAANVHLGDLAEADPTDLYRAAWVQAISALDHWLHREAVARIIATLNDVTLPRPPQLNSLPVPWSVMERTRSEATDEVLREYLTEKLGRESYQKADKISEAVRYVWIQSEHEPPLWKQVAHRLGGELTDKQVKDRQAAYVDRRNQIAHEADRLDGSTVRADIDEADAIKVIDWIADLAAALRAIIE